MARATAELRNLLYRSVIIPREHVIAVTRESNGYAVWEAKRQERPQLVRFEFDPTPAMDYAVNFANTRRSLVGLVQIDG